MKIVKYVSRFITIRDVRKNIVLPTKVLVLQVKVLALPSLLALQKLVLTSHLAQLSLHVQQVLVPLKLAQLSLHVQQVLVPLKLALPSHLVLLALALLKLLALQVLFHVLLVVAAQINHRHGLAEVKVVYIRNVKNL